MSTGWEYRWGDSDVTGEGLPSWVDGTASEWRAVSGSTLNPPGDRSTHLWLRVRLPEGEWPAPAVYFSSLFDAAELYLSGRLLARVGDMEPSWRNRFNYLNWHIALLPPDFGGQYLYFRVYSEDGPNIGLNRRLRIGTQNELVRAVVGHHGDTFVFGTLFIVIGVFALFLSLERRAANRRLYVSFGGFVLCTGIFFVCINSVSQLALSFPAAAVLPRIHGVSSAPSGPVYVLRANHRPVLSKSVSMDVAVSCALGGSGGSSRI